MRMWAEKKCETATGFFCATFRDMAKHVAFLKHENQKVGMKGSARSGALISPTYGDAQVLLLTVPRQAQNERFDGASVMYDAWYSAL